jgi:hypothetical protein
MAAIADKIEKYQSVLTHYMEQLAEERNTALGSSSDCYPVIDTERHHYQLTRMGWHNRKFHFAVLLHFCIQPDGKIWIQHNATEILVGEALESMGVPKTDIVVGFRPEYLRPATGYAVA